MRLRKPGAAVLPYALERAPSARSSPASPFAWIAALHPFFLARATNSLSGPGSQLSEPLLFGLPRYGCVSAPVKPWSDPSAQNLTHGTERRPSARKIGAPGRRGILART